MNLRGDKLLLVFHRGVQKKPTKGFEFPDPTGLITWAAQDRGTVTFKTVAEWKANKKPTLDLIKSWMKAAA